MIDGMTRDMLPYSEHRAVQTAFYQVVVPQVRGSAAGALAYALGRDILDEAGAEPLIQKLWQTEESRQARHDQEHNQSPLAE
jgi:hypothetical protein